MYDVELFPGGLGEKERSVSSATLSAARETWRNFMLDHRRSGAWVAIYRGNHLVDAGYYDSDAEGWKTTSGWSPHGHRQSLQSIPYRKHRGLR